MYAVVRLLCLFDGLRHGEENTVEQDGCHHHVVEVLIGGNVHADAACLVPRFEQEQAVRAGEAVDVVLLEALRDHAEGLRENKRGNTHISLLPAGMQFNVIQVLAERVFASVLHSNR